MNEPVHSRLEVAATAVGVTGVFFILAALIWIMYHYTQPPPVEGSYWAERQRNLAELNAQARVQLDSYAWLDQARDVVRLPVERALELTAREWQDAQEGRARLLALLARALPPVAATNAPASANAPSSSSPSTTNPPAPGSVP